METHPRQGAIACCFLPSFVSSLSGLDIFPGG